MKNLFITILTMSICVGCGEKKEAAKNTDPYKPNLTQTMDVGKVEEVEVSGIGAGINPSVAVNAALKSAITQVNGTVVDASSINFNLDAKSSVKVDIESTNEKDTAKATATLQSQAFAESIISQSKGTVSSFKVVKVNPPKSEGGYYNVEILAKIAKFKKPIDAGKIRIVVMPIKSSQSNFNIGGVNVNANDTLDPIRQQIIDSLTQSGRFTVLDRQFDSEVQSEIGMITNGQTSSDDMAKLSQALSADLIWVGSVNSLSYDKNIKKLQASERELISYSGNWSITQRLINLTTRQVMLSDTFKGEFPTVSPTTLGASVNEKSAIANVQAEIVKKAIDSIILKIFPISIVSIDGDSVVISQGEGSVAEGDRYKVVKLGKEIKDPQTGQSLGNMESVCCEVVINRVTPKLSYGQIDNIKIKLDSVDPGFLQIRGKIVQKPQQAFNVKGAPTDESQKVKSVSIPSANLTPKHSEKSAEKDW